MVLKEEPYCEQLRPARFGVVDVNLDGRGRPVEVEDDVLVGLVVAEPALHDLDDAVDPLLHVFAGDRVQEGSQLVQKIGVLESIILSKNVLSFSLHRKATKAYFS